MSFDYGMIDGKFPDISETKKTIDQQIEKLESLHAASTGGEWRYLQSDGCTIINSSRPRTCADMLFYYPYKSRNEANVFSGEDAEFIAAAHNHLPALIAEVRALQSHIDAPSHKTVEVYNECRKSKEENIALKSEVGWLRSACQQILERAPNETITGSLIAFIAKAALGERK